MGRSGSGSSPEEEEEEDEEEEAEEDVEDEVSGRDPVVCGAGSVGSDAEGTGTESDDPDEDDEEGTGAGAGAVGAPVYGDVPATGFADAASGTGLRHTSSPSENDASGEDPPLRVLFPGFAATYGRRAAPAPPRP